MSNSKASKNALTHGIYSDSVVLDCENKQEFVDLLQAFQDEYCPRQASEEAAVFELASLHWKKRRLEARLQQGLNKRAANSIDNASSDSWDSIADIIRGMAKVDVEAMRVIQEMIFKHLERASNPTATTAGGEVMEFEKLKILAQELTIFGKALASSFRDAEKQQLDQIERVYDRDMSEKELKIQAEINRQIEKVLKRLVLTKEYKKLYVVNAVVSKPLVEIEALPAKLNGVSEKTDPEG